MIKVWTDAAEAGLLDRQRDRGSAFAYLPETVPKRAVSVTMPVRLASWDVPFGLPPIFEMNLPEGALRERLRLAFAKATGTFDDFDLLVIVGRSQVGRIRYTGDKEQLNEDVPFQSVDEILASRRDGDFISLPHREVCILFRYQRCTAQDPRARRERICHFSEQRAPAFSELQGCNSHSKVLGAERISSARCERILLPEGR
jgi:HipA-like protein